MSSRERQPQSGDTRGLRVALFTDTLGDVNGVARFLNDIADRALVCDRSLHILTSTRLAVREQSNVHNFAPRAAIKLPGYRDLEIVVPPARRLFRAIRELRPDVIHISTPGPVGFVGRLIAARLNIPLAGVYHTDFPAYAEHLFDDAALTQVARLAMKRFYKPFDCVFARSSGYGESLGRLGIGSDRRVRLRPGFNVERFHPRFRDERCWQSHGLAASSVKVLYVGRISVEKNLPFLTEIWKQVRAVAPGVQADLVVVGDGPYRAAMEQALRSLNVHFLGFRHGEELSRLYASSDIFACPSTTDTLGQVVLESQASGLPALVTNVGGPQEVIQRAASAPQSGFVLPPGNPSLWARHILELISDHTRRRSMADAAHRHAQNFSIQDSFDHFWRVHEQLADLRLPEAQIEPKPPAVDPFAAPEPAAVQLDSVPA